MAPNSRVVINPLPSLSKNLKASRYSKKRWIDIIKTTRIPYINILTKTGHQSNISKPNQARDNDLIALESERVLCRIALWDFLGDRFWPSAQLKFVIANKRSDSVTKYSHNAIQYNTRPVSCSTSNWPIAAQETIQFTCALLKARSNSRDFTQRWRRRLRKRHLKSEFALPQT